MTHHSGTGKQNETSIVRRAGHWRSIVAFHRVVPINCILATLANGRRRSSGRADPDKDRRHIPSLQMLGLAFRQAHIAMLLPTCCLPVKTVYSLVADCAEYCAAACYLQLPNLPHH